MDTIKLHTMENTNRIVTIIGVCFEAVSLLFLWGILYFIFNFEKLLPFSTSWDIEYGEYMDLVVFVESFSMVFLIISIVISVFVVFNVIVFSRLIRGKFKEKTAKRIYLYQAIYGGLSLSSNQLIGILYLISGIRGFKGEQEVTNIRKGI